MRVGSAQNSINPNTGTAEFGIPGLFADKFSKLFRREENADAAKLPPDMAIPPGMSLRENIKEAEGRWNPFWFRNQVNDGGPWDYKRQDPKYQNFGNFHYGATGAAMGWPDSVLKRLAGENHMNGPNARPEFGHWLKGFPYGDDPADQEMIQKGIDYYYNRGR